MEAIKVSVVVPVYNVDEFLDNTLSDITGQTLLKNGWRKIPEFS